MKGSYAGWGSLLVSAALIGACTSDPSPGSGGSANPATREFTFSTQGGQNVIATTQAQAATTEKRLVTFTPFLERTDGNLYQAALQSLFNLYGKERGLFQLEDAQMKAESSLGGNAICWRISNPTGEYCVFPTRDEKTGRIAALTVWVQ